MSEDRSRRVLARITDTPALARAVPHLQPQVLHALITRCGLQDCGALLALITPEQLSAVFDLDLWKPSHAGGDEQFDADRFCEWLEALVHEGAAFAAARLADMDLALVVAGLSPQVRVFDAAVFSPHGEPSGADAIENAGRDRGLHVEIDRYLVVARRPDAWESIVEALLALQESHLDTFHHAMRACRTLSNSGFELDGLHDLQSDADQARFDLSTSREQRRDRLGFLPPQQARAFLHAARHVALTAHAPGGNEVFTAYQRSSAPVSEREVRSATPSDTTQAVAGPDGASAIASVMEVLHAAGVLADAPRALLPRAPDEPSLLNPSLNTYLRRCAESGDAWTSRNQELAFLANALVGGCSVQGRPVTRHEAVDAVAATCNLGLEYWPKQWLEPTQHGLVTVFQVGWSVLHRDVSMAAATSLLAALDQVRTSDRDLQLGLHALARELHKQRRAGTPWRARSRLDVLATLDLPAWAALTALFDECPVMLANVSGQGRSLHAVNPSEFQFIAGAGHVAAVHRFLLSIAERLTC
jgi:hypothetical protein